MQKDTHCYRAINESVSRGQLNHQAHPVETGLVFSAENLSLPAFLYWLA